jgi:hypothetical protein
MSVACSYYGHPASGRAMRPFREPGMRTIFTMNLLQAAAMLKTVVLNSER